MSLTQILIFTLLGLLAGRFYRFINRGWLLFAGSALAVFWLQPASPIRHLPFLLPALTLGLATLVWSLTRPKDYTISRQDYLAAGGLAGLALLISAVRDLDIVSNLLTARPLSLELALLLVLALALWAVAAYWLGRGRPWASTLIALSILGILIALKSEGLAAQASAALRRLAGQDPALASPLDLNWLGFSYIAFRLVHVLRDRLAGRLPQASLRDFITYIVFFPALTAGPIDRIQHFQPQLENQFELDNQQLLAAGRRLAQGLFMKFLLADGLAFFALNDLIAEQTQSAFWMWMLLIAYSLRIYFDFAGYTHVAIGLGMLFGVRLPENFNRPYLKPNLTAFWNSWHITLAQWFRAYYFNPLARWLRGRRWPVWLIILLAQLSTMALIGLWHGITLNFLIWGLWHGAGLFAHNRWVEFQKGRASPAGRWAQWAGVAATFAFVTIGWVWFAVPGSEQATHILAVLMGAN